MSNAIGKIFAGVCLAVAISLMAAPASAQNVSLSLAIKSKAFQPSTLKAPANKPIAITVHNADGAAAEFESRTLRVEKVIPAGGTVVINVKPLSPGSYRFFDDFNQSNQGTLVVE